MPQVPVIRATKARAWRVEAGTPRTPALPPRSFRRRRKQRPEASLQRGVAGSAAGAARARRRGGAGAARVGRSGPRRRRLNFTPGSGRARAGPAAIASSRSTSSPTYKRRLSRSSGGLAGEVVGQRAERDIGGRGAAIRRLTTAPRSPPRRAGRASRGGSARASPGRGAPVGMTPAPRVLWWGQALPGIVAVPADCSFVRTI